MPFNQIKQPTAIMPPAVALVDLESQTRVARSMSNIDLEKFTSTAPTLNNTPTASRSPSPSRKLRMESSPRRRGDEAVHIGARYAIHELDIAWMGAVIIICFFTSGLIDAVAFNSWNCFVGMQTGNTVFAALGLGGLPQSAHSQQYYKSFTAIGAFCLGTLFFNYLHRLPTGLHNAPSSRRRCIFVLSFFVQTVLIVIAAALVTTGIVSNRPFIVGTFSSGSDRLEDGTNYTDLIAIVILAFEAAGQVCLSRVLSMIELPTIVLSTLFHDFVGDLYMTRRLWRESSSFSDFLWHKARRQEKRLLSIIALFLGGVVGGEMYKSKVGMAGALWLASALKGCITFAFFVWRQQPEKTDADSA